MNDQATHLRDMMRQTGVQDTDDTNPCKVIAVTSGKGGVGKTNFAINFALALQTQGRRPIVIDADIGFANVEVMLDVRPKYTILDILKDRTVWDVITSGPAGLPFLSAGNGLRDIHSLSQADVERVLGQLRLLASRYDTLIIDTGAGMGNNIGKLLTSADELVVLTTPEPTALADAYALLKMLSAQGTVPPVQIVVNRAKNLLEAKVASDKLRVVSERFLNLIPSILGFILEDASVGSAVMNQRALWLSLPNSPAARCVEQVVKNYLRIEQALPRTRMGSFFDRLFRRNRQMDARYPA